ncbi:long-chain-fatty-acid--CoA ligase [Saccharopolyspora taberi]
MYESGPTGRGMALGDQLARHARRTPDTTALVFDGTSRTYRELDERVSRLAGALRERGIGPGDRIAVLSLNNLETVESYLASARLGAICVPVNFRLTAPEVSYVLADSGAAALVTEPAFADVVAAARTPSLRTVLVVGDDYEQALRAAVPAPEESTADLDAPAFVMYTSGTTGKPKGAVLTHQNVLMHAFSTITHLGVPADDRVGMSGAPLFHIAGAAALALNLLVGGTSVLTRSGRFDPAETVGLLARHRVSNCFFVPAQWQAICALPDLARHDLSALRRISWGASPAPTALLRRMIELFPQAQVTTMFGQTECSPVTTVLRGEDATRKIGSVGTPMLNVEVRVVDDDMNDVPRGEVGEIVYRGPMVMKEYWGKPAETAEAFRGGWFHSGDLVRQDADGYFYVVDRKKDMIISGGENIYCAEVEDVLDGHPGIAEVALIGVPDAKWGEVPLAVVVPRDPGAPPTAEEVEAWCRERLAGYKCPRRTAIVPELPRNPSGKVLKTSLRAKFG